MDYITNNSFSFILSNKNELHFPIQQNIQNEDDYIIAYGFQFRFMAFVLSMVRRPTFEANLKEFVSNWRRYFEHLKHQGADPFLLQPISFYEQTIHIHNCMLYISSELNLEMQGIDFQTIKNNLEEMYEYYEAIPRYEVLEHEITVLHSQIQEYIEIIILGIKKIMF